MAPSVAPPLCIDCDGTLIHTDLLHEGLLLLVKQSPRSLPLLPFWLLRGKAHFKAKVAERVRFHWDALPYNERVLEIIRVARDEGRTLVLATASPRLWADGIADHLQRFDRVLATEGSHNMAAQNKASALTELYGARGFDYAGNSRSDLPVWAKARAAIVVSSNESLLSAAKEQAEVTEVVPVAVAGLLGYLKMIRVHQWMKNLLVAVPMAAAHLLSSQQALARTVVAFLAFSLCASAVYVLNDLLDLESDRRHIRKRNRPLAAGRIPVSRAVPIAILLLFASFALSLLLPSLFLAVLTLYFIITLAYSVRLKRQVIVDVLVLAGLYTIRIIAGGAASGVTPSFWLLTFSMFLFLSLAIVKRYSEMEVVLSQNKMEAAGRGYRVSDMPVLLSLGTAAGMVSVMVLSLYIGDPETKRLYPFTTPLWIVPTLILYWISRVWMKAHRGEINDDPVVFAIRDWQSLVTIALTGACFLVASVP